MVSSPDHLTPDHRTVASAMDRAVEIANRGPAYGPNPQVGCVLLAAAQPGAKDRAVLGVGWHQGAGTPHAEAAAITNARERGHDLTGATAVVTLEPCSHTGRTGPCVDALSQAGVAEVIYAVADPGATSGGGAEVLNERGIVAWREPHDGATALTHRWHTSMSLGRPYVIAKWAATLDGRMAAADNTSIWITGPEARAHAHSVRAAIDAIAVGTGTVLADNPELSARPDGVVAGHQPLRVILGSAPTPGSRVWRDDNAVAIASHDPARVLAELFEREVRTLVVEGGPTVLSAFFRAGLVDEVNAYIAPVLLGAGPSVVDGLGIATMSHALRGKDVTIKPLGADTLVIAHFSKGS